MVEMAREELVKELQGLRKKLKESIGHFKRLRREIRLSEKRLGRRNKFLKLLLGLLKGSKLPLDVEQRLDKTDLMILHSFLEVHLTLLDRVREDLKEGLKLEELELETREEGANEQKDY